MLPTKTRFIESVHNCDLSEHRQGTQKRDTFVPIRAVQHNISLCSILDGVSSVFNVISLGVYVLIAGIYLRIQGRIRSTARLCTGLGGPGVRRQVPGCLSKGCCLRLRSRVSTSSVPSRGRECATVLGPLLETQTTGLIGVTSFFRSLACIAGSC